MPAAPRANNAGWPYPAGRPTAAVLTQIGQRPADTPVTLHRRRFPGFGHILVGGGIRWSAAVFRTRLGSFSNWNAEGGPPAVISDIRPYTPPYRPPPPARLSGSDLGMMKDCIETCFAFYELLLSVNLTTIPILFIIKGRETSTSHVIEKAQENHYFCSVQLPT